VLAGKLPWHGGSTEMIDHVGAGRPPDWRLMPRVVPPDLRAIVEKSMAADLAQRYPDAGALAADLRAFTLGNLVVAYEYGFFQKLVRFVRRHRAPVGVGAISLVVLAIVGVISIRRVIAERDDANDARALAEKRQKEARAAADRLLVAHARELVETDPVEAIATLRTLPADSAQWPQAWAVASGAFYKGIPIGFVSFNEPAIPQISPDNAHAFVAGILTGRLMLIDIAKRESREVATLGRVDGIGWFDATHILCVVGDDALFIDITSGARRTLAGFGDSYLHANHQGLAVLHRRGELFEVTSVDGAPVRIAENVDTYAPSPDLRTAVVVRGRKRELWSGGKTFALPDVPDNIQMSAPSHIVRGNLVATLELPDAAVWELKDGKVLERGRWRQPAGTSAILVAEGVVFTAGASGYRRADGQGSPVLIDLASYMQTRTGMLMTTMDGRIILRDERGAFRLGKRHASYRRFDQSMDGNFIIATTQSAEVLVWDLRPLRPQMHRLDPDETPVALMSTGFWTQAPSSGFVMRDRDSADRKIRLATISMLAMFAHSADENVVVGFDFDRSELLAGDIASKGEFRETDVTAFATGEHDLIYAKQTGEVWSWQAASGRKLRANVKGTIDILAEGWGYTLIALDESELIRIADTTHAQERTRSPGVISRIAIDPRGTAWLIAADKPYRWRVGEREATALTAPEPVDGLVPTSVGAMFHSPRSMLVYESANEPRILAKASSRVKSIDGEALLATSDARGVVSIIDVSSGASFDLPLPILQSMNLLSCPPDQIAYAYTTAGHAEPLFGILTLSVPRDPVKLQQWLATITNAKPVPNSEAVAWP
jgi:hypothetical protein